MIDSKSIADLITSNAKTLKPRDGSINLTRVPEYIDNVLGRLNIYNIININKYKNISDVKL